MNGRRSSVVSTMALFLILSAALAAGGCVKITAKVLGAQPVPRVEMVVEHNLMVPMRDGVKLATDVYRPAAEGAYPVVLTRLPYGTDVIMIREVGRLMARSGYVFVAQDTRGMYDSEGEWFPFIFEFEDGHDTVEWISRQPWSNGKIGMWGGSYFGYTQLVAAPDSPYLDCMFPIWTSGSMGQVLFRNGAQNYLSIQGWTATEETDRLKMQGKPGKIEPDFAAGYYNEPLRDAEPIDFEKIRSDPETIRAGTGPWLHHPGDTEMLPPLNYDQYYKTVSAPSLLIAGWYDLFLKPQLDDFNRFRSEGKGDAVRTRIIIGPWLHGVPSFKPADRPFEGLKNLGAFLPWYDFWLKGIDNGQGDGPPVKLFVMGEGVWRDENEWPLARTVYTDYFLASGGQANTKNGDGRLSLNPPADAPADHYDYDPRHPAPTAGGNFLGYDPFQPGPRDQGRIPMRPDVLVYVTDPLTEAVEVTGPVKLVLYAASSARDTDWVAKLLDVDALGQPRLLQVGIVRARYRNGYQHPDLIEPEQVYEYTLDLWATSNLFKKGHRIALWITSSDFPQFDRNQNAAGEGGPENIVIARQTVYHDSRHRSRLVLPVIPR